MKGGAAGGGMGDIVRRAQEAQRNLSKVQDDLRERVVDASSGGGAVTAFVNGQQEIVKISIKPEVVDPADVAMLEDLVTAAVKQALEKSKKMMQEEMSRAMGGFKVPGLF
ncbi:MAG: YbaB/EbfC family nucleoid-associated protein [Planctomycetes bacterium]|nr:YbaB/EbfC family nucleoid-associated protein [Planctomycetota bacterium]